MQQFIIPQKALVAAEIQGSVLTAVITGEDFHYLAHVRRLGPGDNIQASTPDGSRFEMTISERGHDRLSVTLRAISDENIPAILPMTVAQAVVKPSAMDLIVRQATELGVTGILPVLTERSVPAKHAHPRLARWQRIERSASQQSGRTPLTTVASPRSLEEILQSAPSTTSKLVFQPPAPGKAEIDLPDILEPNEQVWLLLGPEGGFSPSELNLIEKAGFLRCALGATVLRSETSMVAAVMAVRFLWYHAASQPKT